MLLLKIQEIVGLRSPKLRADNYERARRASRLAGVPSVLLTVLLPCVSFGQLANGDFESGDYVENGPGYSQLYPGATAIDNWTTAGAAGTSVLWMRNGNPEGLTAPSGERFLDLTGANQAVWFVYGSVDQTFATVPGRTYTLSFQSGNALNFGETIEIYVTVGNQQTIFRHSQSDSVWNQQSMSYTATGHNTKVTFTGRGSNLQFIGLDDVANKSSPEFELDGRFYITDSSYQGNVGRLQPYSADVYYVVPDQFPDDPSIGVYDIDYSGHPRQVMTLSYFNQGTDSLNFSYSFGDIGGSMSAGFTLEDSSGLILPDDTIRDIFPFSWTSGTYRYNSETYYSDGTYYSWDKGVLLSMNGRYVNGAITGRISLLKSTNPASFSGTLTLLTEAGQIASTYPIRVGGEYGAVVNERGRYRVIVKGGHYLAKDFGLITIGSPVLNFDGSLQSGDVDGDNTVSLFDYLILSEAFDSSWGDTRYFQNADLDNDGEIGLFDYLILSENFDLVGD